jgi:hypothetical protein
MIPFFAHFLFILAAWTLTIKFFFPMAYAFWQGEPLLTHVYWDFWWVIHIWLGWALINWRSYTFYLAVSVSAVEIVIVPAKFVIFLSSQQWSIWMTNWFINKLFVLACFIAILGYFIANAKRLRDLGLVPRCV